MVNVGIVGLGFMGMIHYLSYQKVRGAKVKAICETDPKKLSGDWRSIKGNFGPQGTKMDLSGIDRYPELDQILADPKIDLIDICLPPAMHADAVVAALKAGKDVLCEKPIALYTNDARRMMKTSQTTGNMLMIGHMLPLFPEYNFVYEAATSGKFGKLLGGHFKRIISDPAWMTDFWQADRSGGPMIDLHIHDAHYIRLLFGMPNAVQSVGRMRGEVAELFTSEFLFDDSELVVTATSGAINQQGREFTHAFEVYFEKATLMYDFATLGGEPVLTMPLTVLDDKGKVKRPKLGSGDPMNAFETEMKLATKAVQTKTPPEFLAGELARDALILAQKETQSIQRGRAVKV